MNMLATSHKPRYDLKDLRDEAKHPLVKAYIDSHRGKILWDCPKFMAWRARHGYSDNPEEWILDCRKGNNETLIEHASLIKRWVESVDFAGDKKTARERYAKTMKGFYIYHMIRVPPVKVDVNLDSDDVEVEMTAGRYLEMLHKVLTHSLTQSSR